MASFADVAAQHAKRVFINPDHFAREWTRWPMGIEGDAETVDAVWEPDRHGLRHAELDQQKNMFKGTLTVASDQEVDRRDSWISPEGNRYQVEALSDIDEGLRDIRLTRTEKITTSRNGAKL